MRVLARAGRARTPAGCTLASAALAGFMLAAASTPLAPLAAQTEAPRPTPGVPDPAPDAAVIRAVEIRRSDIFEPNEEASWVARVGNALHATTRQHVVERELLFAPGEPFDSAKVAETARNLRSLGVFRRVLIDTVRTDSGLVVRVTTKDGWSTRPQLDFSSVSGQTAWAVGLEEVNLLGNAGYGSVTYTDHPDRTVFTVLFRQPRLLANRVYVQAGYQHRSDGRSLSLGVGQPFFSLASRTAIHLSAVDFDGDVLRFFDGFPTALDTLRRRYSLVRLDAARALVGSPRGFVRLGLLGQIRRDDFVPADAASGPSVAFPRTITAALGPYLWLSRSRFVVVRNFRSFLREEDIDLSPALLVGAYAAPRAFGYERDGVGLQGMVQSGFRTPGGVLALRVSASGLYGSAGLDSGTVRVGGTWLVRPAGRHALAVAAEGGWQKRQVPGEEFDLGLGYGPRAFYAHAFTGDRMLNLTAEYRWTVHEDLWEVMGVGLAAFIDHGGAWYAGTPRRTGTDAGLGLRLGPSRASEAAVLSIDLARRFRTDRQRAGWVLVVSRGVRF